MTNEQDTKCTLQQTIKNCIIRNLVECGLLHGIPNFFKSKHLLTKIIWLLATLMSFLVCIMFIRQALVNFLSFDYITNIKNVIEHPMQFPTISFCSTSNSFNDVSLDQTIFSCIYNINETCKNNSYGMFESFTDYRYGKCYRFNSGKNMIGQSIKFENSYISGRSHGFQLEIYEKNAIALFIHNHSKLPYSFENYNNLNGDAVLLPNGFETDITIHKEIDHRLGEPFNNCLQDPLEFQGNKTLIKWILEKNQTYRHQHCMYLCLDLFYINENPCKCAAELGTMWSRCFIEVENQNRENCTFKYKLNFYKDDFIQKCSMYCPFECDSEKFTKTLSFRPGNSTLRLKFYVFYDELKYTLIEQIWKTSYTDLVSSVGGIFGLFLGMSFLSFVEVFEILFEVLILFSEKKLLINSH